MPGNPDVMTWFPRREDYEAAPVLVPDETLAEKVQRLNDTIEANQANVKEVVDGDGVALEHKIYRTMDLNQDMGDLAALLKDCESHADSGAHAEGLKKAKVGIINLRAYLGQVDVIEFATAIRNEHQFAFGCAQRLEPWLAWAERKLTTGAEKPTSFDHGMECEQRAALFLKAVVKANKSLKTVQGACEGLRGDVAAQDRMGRLQERYFVLCKKAEQRCKSIQQLLKEWKFLEDLLAPEDVKDWDDYTLKQTVRFLRTYAMVYA